MSFECALLWGLLIILFSPHTKCDEIPVSAPSVKECHVSVVTYYSDPKVQWARLKRYYSGCTHVMGNLIVSFLEDPSIDYDLSFLENVTYVSGHVAIFANNFPKVVSLPKLQIIRGKETFRTDSYSAGLVIGANSHQQIYMPSLKEISNGDVFIDLESSRDLCYLDTIDWYSIARHGDVKIRPRPESSHEPCPACSRACEVEGRGRRCWGPSDDLCQWPPASADCDDKCDNRCPVNHPEVCCHDQCAIGCTGPTGRDCLACKDYKLWDGTCVYQCPFQPPSSPHGQDCIQG